LEIIERYGADTARLFILFAAPPERDLEWSDSGVEGCYRFLGRVFRTVMRHEELFRNRPEARPEKGPARDLHRRVHRTIKKVTEDVGERYHFNTAISAIMELFNAIGEYPRTPTGEPWPMPWRRA